jgi:glycosyltransferase involved in cell wall biosynthesis
MKKKICFYINSPSDYQIEFYKCLKKKFNIKVLFQKEKISNFHWRFSKYNWITYIQNNDNKNYIENFLNNYNPDLIIVGGYKLKNIFFIKNWCKKNNVKIYLWLEFIWFKNFFSEKVYNFFLKFFFLNINGILCVGKKALNYYKKFNHNCLNLPYSIKLSPYKKKKFKKKFKNIVFLYAGQIIKRKGVIQLLEAFSMLNNKSCYLNIVGDGNLKKTLKEKYKKNKNIKFFNFMNKKKLTKFFYKNDIFILPSYFDGWGVVVCQAMAAYMPVIGTSKVGSFSDYILKNCSGRLCETNKYSIYNQIDYYINNKKKIREHGLQNRIILAKSNSNVQNAVKIVKKL